MEVKGFLDATTKLIFMIIPIVVGVFGIIEGIVAHVKGNLCSKFFFISYGIYFAIYLTVFLLLFPKLNMSLLIIDTTLVCNVFTACASNVRDSLDLAARNCPKR